MYSQEAQFGRGGCRCWPQERGAFALVHCFVWYKQSCNARGDSIYAEMMDCAEKDKWVNDEELMCTGVIHCQGGTHRAQQQWGGCSGH